MCLLCQGAPSALKALGVSAEVGDAALKYIHIRQLFLPLTLVTSVAQATYLASKDVMTPLKLVLMSGAVNAAGDMLLVGQFGMGIAGAAWATLASQLLLTWALLSGLKARNFLPQLKPPPVVEDLKPFASFAKGITVINFLRVCGFFSCTYYASYFLSTQHLAAQQIMVAVFVFMNTMSQPLLQCCQALLPSLLPGGIEEDSRKARSMVRAILNAALLVGAVSGTLGCLVLPPCLSIPGVPCGLLLPSASPLGFQ